MRYLIRDAFERDFVVTLAEASDVPNEGVLSRK
jgi:hypothetical protein